MEASSKPRRVEIGFAGGLTLALRLHEDAYEQLRQGMGGDGEDRLVEIESEDSRVQIDLAQVVYVRLEIERGGVGFY
jgi:hypothetical protein